MNILSKEKYGTESGTSCHVSKATAQELFGKRKSDLPPQKKLSVSSFISVISSIA